MVMEGVGHGGGGGEREGEGMCLIQACSNTV